MHTTGLARLRTFAHEAADQRNLAWTLTWLVLCIDALWVLLAGWSVSGRGVAAIAWAVAVFFAPLAIGRYRRDLRIQTTVRAAALLIVFQAAGATLSYLVISTNAPLFDAPLAAWDSALGFDWLAMHTWVQSQPWARLTLRVAYHSGILQLAFVILFLGFTGRTERLQEFMRLFILTTLVTIVVSGILPAGGTWKHYASAGPFDVSFLSHFELLRDGSMHDIPLTLKMQGLISFPSLHAAMALQFIHAVRGTRLLPGFVVLDAAMLVSTPVTGGHYVVDVLAGAALVFGLIALDRRRSAGPRAAETTVAPGVGAMQP